MMPPLDRSAFGVGQPEHVFDYEDWISGLYSQDIFDNLSTPVSTDPVSRDLLFTSSVAGRGPENYYSADDLRHAEVDLQILRSSPDYFPLFNSLGSAENLMPPGALAVFQLSDQQPQTETVQGLNGEFGESLQMSGTSLEQEEELVDDARRALIEDIITSWPATELYPAIDDSDVNGRKCVKKRKRSTTEKFTAEIRISKKLISWRGKLLKDKAWLGTYETDAQKQRALDVGKFFFCLKKKKHFFYPDSEVILSPFAGHLHALPRPEFVQLVKKMARRYGEHGSLPEDLHDL